MQELKPQFTEEMQDHVGDRKVWHAPAFKIRDYRSLVEHIARLSYANRNQLLFFRGQGADYQSKARGSSLYPGIYRGDNLVLAELEFKIRLLDNAGQDLSYLFEEHKISGWRDIKRKKYMQWSILQHYEVVPTPLIDITQSLRVACSFAQHFSEDDKCYVFVVGLPYPTNRISINSEEEIVNIRLLSICPPNALRPYFQEGYLAGTPDVTSNYDTKTELDLRNRLIAKFEIPSGKSFWNSGVEIMPKKALYPENDQVHELCKKIIPQARMQKLGTGEIGNFIIQWARLEEIILSYARKITQRNLSIPEALRALVQNGVISPVMASELDIVRRIRNVVAHKPDTVNELDVHKGLEMLKYLSKIIETKISESNRSKAQRQKKSKEVK